jgi:hypothetical protein
MRTQPKLSKGSSSALIDLGQAISGNATSEETALLLSSTLVQEAYARNASLQALQVIPLTVKIYHQPESKSDAISLLISLTSTGHRNFLLPVMTVMRKMRALRDIFGMITVLTWSKCTRLRYLSFSVCELGSRFALFGLTRLLIVGRT